MVTSYRIHQAADFVRRGGLSRALRFIRDRRVHNVIVQAREVSALVFDPAHPMPYGVCLRFGQEEFSWDCECGASKPCVHSGALMVYAFYEKLGVVPWSESHLQDLLDRREDQGEIPDPGGSEGLQFDLFGEAAPAGTGAGRGPGAGGFKQKPGEEPVRPGARGGWDIGITPDLKKTEDETPAETPEKESEPEHGADRGREKPVLSPGGAGEAPERSGPKQLMFRVVHRRGEYWLEAVYRSQHGGVWQYEPYSAGEIAEALPDAQEELLFYLTRDGRSAQPLEEVLESLDEILDDPSIRLPIYFGDEDIPLRIVHVQALQVRFLREEVSPQGEAPYRPVFTWRFDEGARALGGMAALEFVTRRGLIYWYQQDRNWLCFADGWYREIRLLQELRFTQETWFSADMIEEMVARCRAEGLSQRIDIQFSAEDRDVVSPRPALVVLVQGDGEGTELFIRFAYPGWEVGYQDQAMEAESRDSQGQPCVLRRNFEAETALVHQLVAWVDSDLVYERGFYSSLVKKTLDPDIRIQTPINAFLLGYARDLIGRGVEVRIENRRVKLGRDLRFSIRREMDWFGIQAQADVEPSGLDADSAGGFRSNSADGSSDLSGALEIQGDGPGGLSESDEAAGGFPVALDEGFARYGLARRGREYVILRERDVRQLEYLRRQGMTEDGLLKTSAANLVLIDAIYDRIIHEGESLEGLDLEDRQEVLGHLQDPDTIPQVDHPLRLQAELRYYQRTGLSWLVYLHRNNLNGCLADDMGLGKTLQTLALLQYLRESGDLGAVLLITPVVTLANWEQEAHRFAPGLGVYRHSGMGRANSVDEMAQADIILVSYHTLRIDIELFLDFDFDYVILDEAHYIKNHYSQVFKAVRSLKSRHRLSLTGTPIENTLMELWSQMNFLNPGLLGTAKHFYERYFVPIEKHGNAEVLEELKELVQPFILRRTKTQVLDDLPAKEVIVQYCEMDEAQAAVYREYRNTFRDRILGIFDGQSADLPEGGGSQGGDETQVNDEAQGGEKVHSENLSSSAKPEKPVQGNHSSIEIFQFLLKLRQLAIHPPMMSEQLADLSSAKMEGLLMLLEEILTENHKVLIFSQFIGSLEAIADHCRERKWGYSLLTGSTQDREGEIQRFQEQPNIRVFLLSLKAGGVGINLTAADYVILFDPWWNPAAENQAIDRAHRMGQQRKVIAYKMIVRGTIEEKILQLQERKSALADEIVADGGGFLSMLDQDEVVHLFSE
ncbi:DEAD/DEAH box helicase [Spirochaeta lutea]|uniref:DEAD/DEAH box helicase n=1 Tax=Spirochaeta lutea TaxID=1480694 RepID=UPI00068F80C4|nr:DEAD/DEAH box helicase [Spirochaeta lutea]